MRGSFPLIGLFYLDKLSMDLPKFIGSVKNPVLLNRARWLNSRSLQYVTTGSPNLFGILN